MYHKKRGKNGKKVAKKIKKFFPGGPCNRFCNLNVLKYTWNDGLDVPIRQYFPAGMAHPEKRAVCPVPLMARRLKRISKGPFSPESQYNVYFGTEPRKEYRLWFLFGLVHGTLSHPHSMIPRQPPGRRNRNRHAEHDAQPGTGSPSPVCPETVT